jgi:hypothetical protein
MSISAISSQVVATQLEMVRQKLAYFLVQEESAFAKKFVGASEKHNVSAFYDTGGSVLAFRIPVLLSKGGDYQGITLDGGDLGSGSMMNTAFMSLGAFESDIAFQVPARANMATQSAQQAITKVLTTSIASAISEMAINNEIGLFGDGTGILATGAGTGSPSISGGQVTYNLESTQFAWNRLRQKGTLLDIYSTANLLLAQGARVVSINQSISAPTVTLSVPSYSPTNTDQLAFPSQLGTVGTTVAAAGSWRAGIYTYNTTNTTGSLNNLPYSNAYEMICPTVNLGGGYYTPSAFFSGKSQLIQRRDDKAISGIIGVSHMAQRVGWYNQGVSISNWLRSDGSKGKMPNLVPEGVGYGDTYEAGDVTHYVNRYANKSRVDWLDPKNFGWVQYQDIDFMQMPDGQRIFIGRSATTGNPQAGYQFYVVNSRNLYSVDPGCSCVFYNGAIPTGQ